MCVLVWPYTHSPAAVAAAKYPLRKQEREAVKHNCSQMRNTNALSGITLCTLKHTTEQVRASHSASLEISLCLSTPEASSAACLSHRKDSRCCCTPVAWGSCGCTPIQPTENRSTSVVPGSFGSPLPAVISKAGWFVPLDA